MVKVINWTAICMSKAELEKVMSEAKLPIRLTELIRQWVNCILREYPWEGRSDLIELFDPSQRYQHGQMIAIPKRKDNFTVWRIVKIASVEEAENPVQGCFQIVRLEDENKALAAGIPGTTLAFSPPSTDAEWAEMANYFLRQYRDNLRCAFLKGLEQFQEFIYMPQKDLLVHQSQLLLLPDDIVDSLAKFLSEPKDTNSIIAYLRKQGYLTNVSDEKAYLSVIEFLERNGCVCVSKNKWLSPKGVEIIDRELKRQPPAPRVFEDEEYYEIVKLPPEGQSLAEEIGEEPTKREAQIECKMSIEEWREQHRVEPVKLPPLTFQNIREAYFPLTRQLSGFLPPGELKEVTIYFRAEGESEPMVFWVSRRERNKRSLKADLNYINSFQQWLASQGIPPGTTFWLERISDFKYRIFARQLDPPRKVKKVKFPSIQNGELKFEFEEAEQRWEGDTLLFKAELRFEDLEALWEEAKDLGLRITTIVRTVFEQIDPDGNGMHWSEVFNATYLVRMCSPRTVLNILYQQPCFESLGEGRFRLNVEVPLIHRSTVRRAAIELFDVPSSSWANRSFVVKIRTRYCQQVALEYSQDGQNWRRIQSLVANPNGQKTQTFNVTLPEPGRWYLKVIATSADSRILKNKRSVQVIPEPVVPPEVPKPEEEEKVINVFLPFTLPIICFPIPFASKPVSESVIRGLERLTKERHLPPLHHSGQIQLLEGEQPRLSLLPEQADDILQKCVTAGREFVTHRLIADFMVNLAHPKSSERVADICCGSGIFLVKAWRFVKEVYGEDGEVELFGADIRDVACKATRLNLEANDFANNQNVLKINSLSDELPEDAFDIVLGNPPFELEKVTGFLNKWMTMLKEGGRMVVLVPSGILTGSQQRHIRKRLVESGKILAIISLPALGEIYGAAGNVLFWKREETDKDHTPVLITITSKEDLESSLNHVLKILLLEDVKARIIEILQRHPNGLRSYKVSQLLGLESQETNRYLEELAKSSQVRRRQDEDGFECWYAL